MPASHGRWLNTLQMSEESRPLVCYQLIDKARLEVYDAVTACVSLYAQDDINDILGAVRLFFLFYYCFF